MSSPSEMFSCVDAATILRSPVNNSTAKNQWSFAKAQRFPNYKAYCDSMYELPSAKSKRHTGFGYGKKTDLEAGKDRHNVAPPPDAYNLASFIEVNKMQNKGCSPGKGRDQVAPVSYIPLEGYKVPGPGAYSLGRPNDVPYWSMRPRTSSQLFEKTTQKMVPGPGRYESCQSLSASGKYYTTKHQGSKSKVWNPKHSERFSRSGSPVPGPGAYNPKNDLSASGDYILSNNPSAGRRKVLLSKRDSFVDTQHRRTQSPGPGTYRLPSDFGQYDEEPLFLSARSTARSGFAP